MTIVTARSPREIARAFLEAAARSPREIANARLETEMSDNADLLTNAAAALERYRAEERVLELELSVLQARLELVREFTASLSGKPRTRRTRTSRVAVEDLPLEMPLRVAGGAAEPEQTP